MGHAKRQGKKPTAKRLFDQKNQIQMFKLSDSNLKITMFNMLKNLAEKVGI